MGPATAQNASNNHAPPIVEFRAGERGSIEIWSAGQQAGGLEPEAGGFRLILGDADPGGGLTLSWSGDPISLRIDLTGALE